MKLALPLGILLAAVTIGAGAVAVWASVADAPWESNEGSAKGSEGSATLLCEDALERRKAVEAALQAPVSLTGAGQIPLITFRDVVEERDRLGQRNTSALMLRDEVIRLESKLRDIERDIQRFCQ